MPEGSVGPAITPAPPGAATDHPRGPDFADLVIPESSEWAAGELFLLHGFRNDARPSFNDDLCRQRRSDLPRGATHGVECEPIDGPVERVGAYLFPDDAAARAAYENRLAEYGLGFDDDGDCPFTEAATVPADARPHSACFVNEFGRANLRLFWPGQNVVVGALGRDSDTHALARWLSVGQPDADSPVFAGPPWTGGVGQPIRFDACATDAMPKPIEAPMAFAYESFGGRGIWLRDLSTTADRLVTTDGGAAAWSPDGRLLAYVREGTDDRSEIRGFSPDTGEDRLLVTAAVVIPTIGFSLPAIQWSPDSTRLAFTGSTYTEGELGGWSQSSVWLTTLSTGETVKLAIGVAFGWSADGTRLLVGLGDTYDPTYEQSLPIAVFDLRTGEQSIIGRGSSATWSADCRFVSLRTLDARTHGAVVFDGINTRPRLALSGWPGDWSPTSADLLFAAGDEMWVASADTGAARRIGQGTGATWSPDGELLAVMAEQTGLTVTRADGSDASVVAGPAYPTRWVAWSPDARFILSFHYFTAETCGGPTYGFLIATNGTGVERLPQSGPMAWRPVTPPGPGGDLSADPPPERQEGCGG